MPSNSGLYAFAINLVIDWDWEIKFPSSVFKQGRVEEGGKFSPHISFRLSRLITYSFISTPASLAVIMIKSEWLFARPVEYKI